MKKINAMELVFENCTTSEKLWLGTDVAYANFKDVRTDFAMIEYNFLSGIKTATCINLKINKCADTKLIEFGRESDKTLFQKISGDNDIAYVCLYYDDGTQENIYTDWADPDMCSNDNQTCSYVDENIIITIVDKENIA